MTRKSGAVTRSALVAWVALVLGLGIPPAPASAAQARDIKPLLLTLSDLPAGWHAHPSTATALDIAGTPCLRGLSLGSGARMATASFVEGPGLPAFAEALSMGATPVEFDHAVAALTKCRSLILRIGSKRVKTTITKITLPVPGVTSHAFSLGLTVTEVPIGVDIVLFRASRISGEIDYLAVGSPTPLTAEAFAAVAVSKAERHAVSPPKTFSIVSSPAKVVRTKMGTVGYREVGSGSPLVLVMGFSGTMETWDPRFVDALAHEHEVVIFDNAGIGHTRALPAPLTIDEMADQTSALISALRLGRPDVLGWSMGTMIAQALAVLHPTQVNRLVLCAGYPGTGTVEPTQEAIKALTNGNPAAALAELFPANQRSAATGYEVSVSDWPKSSGARAGVVAAQEKAITEWWSGRDAAGMRTNAISVPTLILDGTLDRLDPRANAHRLQRLIHGAELSLYPDAGHAFLFQDENVVVPRVELFLESPEAQG